MEAIGAGANVLAFVILGLKSAKFVHDTLSAINDGPQIVQQVARDILQLHWILERLSKSRAAAHDTPLLSHAQQCVQDLNVLSNTVQKLQLTRSEKVTGRLWKRFKTVLSEKDLARVNSQVAQHATFLQFRINLLSSDATFDMRDANHQLMQTTQALNASMEKQFDSLTHRFDKIGNAIFNATAGQESIEPRDRPTGQGQPATQGMSVTDFTAMQAMLQEIHNHLIASPGCAVSDPKTDQDDFQSLQTDNDEVSNVDQQMLDSLDRLCGLVDEKQRAINTYTDDDELAESIIEDLQQLVRYIKKNEAPVQRTEDGSSDSGELFGVPFQSGLGRFGREFGRGSLSINGRVDQKPHYASDTRIQQARTFDRMDIGVGKLSLLIQKRKRSTPDSVEDNKTTQKQSRIDYKMALTFLPNGSRNRHMLVASTFQHQTLGEGISSISTLMVNRVLPASSLVFELVREGNLQQLQQMFRDGKASPRDHDEYGASLLHYSTMQPAICKFLIACGLDVDHLAAITGLSPDYPPDELECPLQMEVNDFERPGEELASINRCRKILLEAGADPTLNVTAKGYSASFLETVSANGVTESLRIVWNSELVRHYGTISSLRTSEGYTSLLEHCRGYLDGFSVDSFKMFLALGSDVRERADGGLTCLHICLGSLNHWRAGLQEFCAIKYLVESGADPHAVDDNGRSVSDVAYRSRGIWNDQRGNMGSYPGDLWDAVLQNCGFDISQFRSRARRRKARYTKEYDRAKFEALWKQRESKCPYWDDMPWPPLEPGEADIKDDETDYEDNEDDEGDEEDESEETDETDDADSDADELNSGVLDLDGRTTPPMCPSCGQRMERYQGLTTADEEDLEDPGSRIDESVIPAKIPDWNEWSNEEGYVNDRTDDGGETMDIVSQVFEMDLDNPWTD